MKFTQTLILGAIGCLAYLSPAQTKTFRSKHIKDSSHIGFFNQNQYLETKSIDQPLPKLHRAIKSKIASPNPTDTKQEKDIYSWMDKKLTEVSHFLSKAEAYTSKVAKEVKRTLNDQIVAKEKEFAKIKTKASKAKSTAETSIKDKKSGAIHYLHKFIMALDESE